LRDTQAIPILIEALDDESSQVRREAADALGQFQDESAVEALKLALQD
jgi:HEAT repeat protein